jgi:hypothetical protein
VKNDTLKVIPLAALITFLPGLLLAETIISIENSSFERGWAAFDDFELRANVTNSPVITSITTLGPATIVPMPANPVYFFANDSAVPYLPNSNGTANITFLVDGLQYRTSGKSFDAMGRINPTYSVLSGDNNSSWDNGDWLLSAVRRNGVLYGFYHAEDYTCKDAYFWMATGLATSTDDGANWVKQGKVIGSPNPCRQNGGLEATFVVWDHLNNRWMGWGQGNGYVSYATNAAPGTWYAWDGTGFNTPMPGGGTATALPGLPAGAIGHSAVAWSSYLNKWVMLYLYWGGSTIYVTFSDDGVTWSGTQTLYTPITKNGTTESIQYPQWIGSRADWIGQDCLLVYGSSPPTGLGQRHDTMERWVHFGPMAIPATPTNVAAAGVGTFGTNVFVSWNATPMADRYVVLRSTNRGVTFTKLTSLATSASFPTYTDSNVVFGQTYYYSIQASNSFGLSLTPSVVMASPVLPGTNGVISINFVGRSSYSMGAAETAGAVAVAQNWNNASNSSGTISSLKYDAGGKSGVSVNWSSSGTWNSGISYAPGDCVMMDGYLDGSSSSVTVLNISAAFTNSSYSVYVYCEGNVNGRTGRYTIGSTTIRAVDSSSYYGSDGSYNYVQASNSVGNYVVFSGLTTNKFTLVCQGVGGGDGVLRAPVNGLQLVATSLLITNPPSLSAQLTAGGNVLALSWPDAYWRWVLQSNSLALTVTNGWYDLSGTTSGTSFSALINAKQTNTFFRLRKP